MNGVYTVINIVEGESADRQTAAPVPNPDHEPRLTSRLGARAATKLVKKLSIEMEWLHVNGITTIIHPSWIEKDHPIPEALLP